MDERTKQYQKEGRAEAKRLFPIPDKLCFCGNGKATDRHHIDGDTHNNIAGNIALYCHKCHLRLERLAANVGSHTRLTDSDIGRIKDANNSIAELSKELGLHPAYLQKIRTGKKNPKTYTPVIVPDDWIPARHEGKQVRFTKHALTTEQVKELKGYMFMRQSLAEEYASKWHVTPSTIYKAKAGHGGYGHPRYDI